jgi:hypothetical protein
MTKPSSSLSNQLKEAVRTWVPKVRKVLEVDFEAQLQRLGILRGGKRTPIEKMNLAEADRAVRARVESLLQRDIIAEGTEKRGFENVLRELTYTCLNRLVGLKTMEARKLLYLPPASGGVDQTPEETEVITLIPGQSRSRYLRDLRAAGGDRYKYEDDAKEALLQDGLTAAYRYITQEIRLLFDPDHEYACVWPTYACLVKVFDMINHELSEEAYRAPDFLGWVYQFFNREEKKKVRDENKGTPRSSYELAVINQFYTPSWVVKALVDNTLGRLWCQMHPDSKLFPTAPPPLPEERTSEEAVADYLVPRTGERIRYQRLTDTGQVETFKLAKDITLLDPACGTMHFGQYAFGLFHQMYLEEIQHAGEEGWPQEPSVKHLVDIPLAIVEHNLFGIDIDPRAIQIASLSLMLTVKEAALKQGQKPYEIRISRTNLVVANAVNLGEEQLRKLVKKLAGRLGESDLQERLFTTLWENLQFVGELGSLVQVQEGVRRVLSDWVERQAGARGLTRMPQLQSDQLELGDILREQARQIELQRQLLEEEAEQLRQELLAAVEAAAAWAEPDTSERLFAEDTARGLKLLQTLSRRFDVLVMNPPYGSFVPKVRDFIKKTYPLTANDIYATFIERTTQLVEELGYIGALVSSTFTNLTSFQKLRTEILLKRNPLLVMLDLGFGILDDAAVEAAAIVLKGSAT